MQDINCPVCHGACRICDECERPMWPGENGGEDDDECELCDGIAVRCGECLGDGVV